MCIIMVDVDITNSSVGRAARIRNQEIANGKFDFLAWHHVIEACEKISYTLSSIKRQLPYISRVAS